MENQRNKLNECSVRPKQQKNCYLCITSNAASTKEICTLTNKLKQSLFSLKSYLSTSYVLNFAVHETVKIDAYKLSVTRVIKQILVIIEANYVQNFIQHPAVKVNSICRGNYWGTSMWIWTQHVNY